MSKVEKFQGIPSVILLSELTIAAMAGSSNNGDDGDNGDLDRHHRGIDTVVERAKPQLKSPQIPCL